MRSAPGWICSGAVLVALGCASASDATRPVAPRTTTAPRVQDALSAAEWAELHEGGRVERPMVFDRNGARYVGGVAYQLVDAGPDEVLQALLDHDSLAEMLPKTRRILPIGPGHPPAGFEVEQGNDLIQATYSVVLAADFEQRQLRFWLDRSRPSDIQDVWGFFRVIPYEGGRSLITVGAALDVGPGIVRLLFEDKIQKLILTTPTRMKVVIEASPPDHRRASLAQLP